MFMVMGFRVGGSALRNSFEQTLVVHFDIWTYGDHKFHSWPISPQAHTDDWIGRLAPQITSNSAFSFYCTMLMRSLKAAIFSQKISGCRNMAGQPLINHVGEWPSLFSG